MNTQPVGFRLTGPAFMFETHLAGRPQADRLRLHILGRPAMPRGFVLVPDDAPPSLTSPATSSSSSPPTPRPPPPTVEPPPPGLGQNAGQSPGQSPEPATAPLWAKCTRWGLRLALKKKLWAHLGSHLKYIKPVGVADDASGTSRRREGGARLTRVGSGLTSPPQTPEHSALRGQDAPDPARRRFFKRS